MSFDLFSLAKSFLFMLKYFATVSFMKSLDITFSLFNLNSFIISSACSIVIGLCVNAALATILLKTPSSSRMFESIFVAIFDNIASSIIIFSS